MMAVNVSALRRRRLQLAAAAAAGTATLTVIMGVTGTQAGAAPAATPTPSVPSPSGSTPDTSPFPPGPPTDLTATQVTTTSVTLTWTASTPGCCAIDGYSVSYRPAFSDVGWSQSVGNVTTATIAGSVVPGTQYQIAVSARDVVGHTSTSSSISVVTPVSSTGDTTPPPAPRNLTAGSPTGVTTPLSWTAPADTSDVAGYNVYGFDGWFVSTLLGTTTGTTFDAPGVSGPMPQYYVRARDAAGNVSLASNTVRALLSSSPRGPSTSPSITAPPACRVTYTSQAQWTNGFVAGITIVNTGQSPVNGWTLTFTFGGDQRITGYWGAEVSQSGAAVTARNATWNGTIRPGASASFGIQGMWGASNGVPTAFSLNGGLCATG